MAIGATDSFHENRSVDCVAELHTVSIITGADLQRLHTARGEEQGGLELDVDIADRLQFPASGGQHRQRYFSDGLCPCRYRLRLSRMEFAAVKRSLDVRTCCGVIGRRQGEQPATAAALGFARASVIV